MKNKTQKCFNTTCNNLKFHFHFSCLLFDCILFSITQYQEMSQPDVLYIFKKTVYKYKNKNSDGKCLFFYLHF
jgi:hypothetical protein